MNKKILSFALVLVLVLALVPAVSAAESKPSISTIAVGGHHVVVIGTDGSLWAWGGNEYGQLGNGTTTEWPDDLDSQYKSMIVNSIPIRIGTDMDWKSVAAGSIHTVAIKNDGSLWIWGNYLIEEAAIDMSKPIRIGTDNDWASVAANLSHTIAIKKDGSLWAWGANSEGQIGDVTDTYITVPTRIGTDSNWKSVSTNRHTVAIKTDGSLWAWGWNYSGQLGDGTETDTKIPIQIGKDTDWVSAVAGVHYTLAIKADGSLWSLNSGKAEQIGTDKWVYIVANGERNNYTSATAIQADGSLWALDWDWRSGKVETALIDKNSVWTNAVVGNFGYFSLAIKADGSLWAQECYYAYDDDYNTSSIRSPLEMIWPAANPLDSANTWAHEGITSALEKGFVPTEIQNNYTNVITRLEFCRMAVKWVEYATGKNIDTVLSEQGKSRDTNAFTDTNDPDILAAFALGITNGTGNNQFTPNGQFSREQAATMIMNTCGAIGRDVSNLPTSDFVDLGAAETWAVDGINFVQANGIMQGTGDSIFDPKATYTREQSIITFDNISK